MEEVAHPDRCAPFARGLRGQVAVAMENGPPISGEETPYVAASTDPPQRSTLEKLALLAPSQSDPDTTPGALDPLGRTRDGRGARRWLS